MNAVGCGIQNSRTEVIQINVLSSKLLRSVIVGGVFGVIALPACAHSESTSADIALDAEVLKCSQKAGDAERLQCFDALAAAVVPKIDDGVGAQAAAEAEPSATVPPRAPSAQADPVSGLAAMSAEEVRAAQVEQFGANQLDRDKRPTSRPVTPLKSLDAVVVRIDENPYGKLTLWLENGQVWRQTGNGRFGFEQGEELAIPVRLSSGIFGGYKVKRLDHSQTITVRRIR